MLLPRPIITLVGVDTPTTPRTAIEWPAKRVRTPLTYATNPRSAVTLMMPPPSRWPEPHKPPQSAGIRKWRVPAAPLAHRGNKHGRTGVPGLCKALKSRRRQRQRRRRRLTSGLSGDRACRSARRQCVGGCSSGHNVGPVRVTTERAGWRGGHTPVFAPVGATSAPSVRRAGPPVGAALVRRQLRPWARHPPHPCTGRASWRRADAPVDAPVGATSAPPVS